MTSQRVNMVMWQCIGYDCLNLSDYTDENARNPKADLIWNVLQQLSEAYSARQKANIRISVGSTGRSG